MTDFLDTNILLYSISARTEDIQKRTVAEGILDSADWRTSVQVLQEFSYQAMRSSRTDRLTIEQVDALVRHWLQFGVQDLTGEIVLSALGLSKRYGFSYWDSAIIAAAHTIGCTRLLTEDLQHGQIIDGLTVVNPFL